MEMLSGREPLTGVLLVVVAILPSCAGARVTVPVSESPRPNQSEQAPPTPSTGDSYGIPGECSIVAQGLPSERCFDTVAAACDAIRCPRERCELVYSFPGMATCR